MNGGNYSPNAVETTGSQTIDGKSRQWLANRKGCHGLLMGFFMDMPAPGGKESGSDPVGSRTSDLVVGPAATLARLGTKLRFWGHLLVLSSSRDLGPELRLYLWVHGILALSGCCTARGHGNTKCIYLGEYKTKQIAPDADIYNGFKSLGGFQCVLILSLCNQVFRKMSVFGKFRLFNRQLSLAALLISVSTFNYGFDNQAFATTQAMDAFTRQFGDLDEKTGRYALEPSWLSLFNSINYVGFAFGECFQ